MLYFPVYSTVGSLEGLSSQLLCSTGTSRTPRGGPELCNVVRHIPWLDVGLLTVPFERLSQLYLLSWENHAGVVLRCWTCWPERLRYRRADYLFAGNFLLVSTIVFGLIGRKIYPIWSGWRFLAALQLLIQLRPMQDLIKVACVATKGGQVSIATGCQSIYDLSRSGMKN